MHKLVPENVDQAITRVAYLFRDQNLVCFLGKHHCPWSRKLRLLFLSQWTMTFFLKSSFKREGGIKDMKVTGMFLNFLQLKRACKSYLLYSGQQSGLQDKTSMVSKTGRRNKRLERSRSAPITTKLICFFFWRNWHCALNKALCSRCALDTLWTSLKLISGNLW